MYIHTFARCWQRWENVAQHSLPDRCTSESAVALREQLRTYITTGSQQSNMKKNPFPKDFQPWNKDNGFHYWARHSILTVNRSLTGTAFGRSPQQSGSLVTLVATDEKCIRRVGTHATSINANQIIVEPVYNGHCISRSPTL